MNVLLICSKYQKEVDATYGTTEIMYKGRTFKRTGSLSEKGLPTYKHTPDNQVIAIDSFSMSIPEPGSFDVFAIIRPDSKYHSQNPQQLPFKVKLSPFEWQGNGNNYKSEDLDFFHWVADANEYWSMRFKSWYETE